MTEGDEPADRLRGPFRRWRAGQASPQRVEACVTCGRRRAALLHDVWPALCPGQPPLGGWPEPGKEDL